MSEGSAGRGSSTHGPEEVPEGPAAESSVVDSVSRFEQQFPGGSRSANASVRAMVRTTGAIMATFHTALRHHSLSASGRQALAALDSAGEPMTPTAIAERLLVTTASITSLLDTLEGRGLVTRRRDTADRRKQLVSLTEEGQQVVDDFLPQIVALQTAMMAGISEEDRHQLRRSLDAIRANIAAMDAHAVTQAAAPRGPHVRR